MKDLDFKGTQLLLFGEEFGEKAKARMEAAAALQKIVTLAGSKGKQTGFQKGHPQKNTWGHQVGKSRGPNFKPKKFQGSKPSQGKSRIEMLDVPTPQVSTLNRIVNPTPLLTQVST